MEESLYFNVEYLYAIYLVNAYKSKFNITFGMLARYMFILKCKFFSPVIGYIRYKQYKIISYHVVHIDLIKVQVTYDLSTHSIFSICKSRTHNHSTNQLSESTTDDEPPRMNDFDK